MPTNTNPVALANPHGKAFVLDANGSPSWRPWAEVSASAPEGHFLYQLGGEGHWVAALGPPPPAGVSSAVYAWHPGRPTISPLPETKPRAASVSGATPAFSTGAADPHGWLGSIERVCGAPTPLPKA